MSTVRPPTSREKFFRLASAVRQYVNRAPERLFRLLSTIRQYVNTSWQDDSTARAALSEPILTADQTEEEIAELVEEAGSSPAESALPVLGHFSHHPSPSIRRDVAAALGRFGYLEVIGTLLGLLTDPSHEVRETATLSLGRLGSSYGLPLLNRMSHDNSELVRLAALKALWQLEDKTGADVLSLCTPLLLDTNLENAVTAFQITQSLRKTEMVDYAALLNRGVRSHHPTLFQAATPSGPAEVESLTLPGDVSDSVWDQRRQAIRVETFEHGVATSGLNAFVERVKRDMKPRNTRHLSGWWEGMDEDGTFTPGEPDFISSIGGFKYRFSVGITTQDTARNYLLHELAALGSGATTVAVALVADNEYLEVDGECVKEIQVPAEGDSSVAQFMIRGLKPGDSSLEVLVYHRGCLILRAPARITVKHLDGRVSHMAGLPVTATVLSKGDDISAAAGAIAQNRVASLLIDEPKINPNRDLLFALFYQDESGYHFATARVPRERAEIDPKYVRCKLRKLIKLRRGILGRFWKSYRLIFLRDTFDLQVELADGQKGLAILREVGHSLWSGIFSSEGLQTIRERLQKLLYPVNAHGVLQIVSDQIYLPWQLVYLDNGEDKPVPELFWGMRFQIEQTLATGLNLRFRPPSETSEPVTAYINSGLPTPTIQKHREIKIFSAFRDNETELLDDLKRIDNSSAALYLYCHAEYNPNDPNESWIELTSDQARLTLRTLRDRTRLTNNQAQVKFQSAPLIFLNACKSGQMESSLYRSFVGFMLGDKKAGGVIGTETEMPAFFATAFAQEFWGRIQSDPAPIGKVLFDLRKHYWETYHNPLGFLYSLYANGDFTITVRQEQLT